jgi:hypothetical protein
MARAALAATMLVLLAACAQPARVSQMVAPNVMAPVTASNPELLDSITIAEVKGGQSTNPMWTSQVDNPEFKEALDRSLAFNGLLAADAAKARYAVTAELLELKQPLMGFDLTVTSRVKYSLQERGGAATELFGEEIVTPYTADFSSSLVAVERLRLANEGAIRESIRNFLVRLGDSWSKRTGRAPIPQSGAQPAATPAPAAAPTAGGKPTS